MSRKIPFAGRGRGRGGTRIVGGRRVGGGPRGGGLAGGARGGGRAAGGARGGGRGRPLGPRGVPLTKAEIKAQHDATIAETRPSPYQY